MAVEISLTGKTCLVTGGTRGIGKAIAIRFLQAGAKLIVTGTRKKEEADLSELQSFGIVDYLQLLAQDDNSVESFIGAVNTLANVDILINNAGINIVDKVQSVSPDDFKQIQKINVETPYLIARALSEGMRNRGWGRIVNIASIWSVVTRSGRSAYSTSKNAMIGFTETMAVEWSKDNVLVNAVSPGFTKTELTMTTNTPEEIEAISSLIPQNRMADPVEMANVVLFLSSEMNTYLTGQNLVVDGGYTII